MIHPGGAALNIANGIREFSVATPNAIAIIDGTRIYSYAEVNDRANRIANYLLYCGLEKGSTVALILDNQAEYIEIAAGLSKAGLIIVPVNPRLTPSEVEYILNHSGSQAIILHSTFLDALEQQLSTIHHNLIISLSNQNNKPNYGVDYETVLLNSRSSDPNLLIDETKAFAIFYTSGTTGKPKGVTVDHRGRCLTFLTAAIEWNLGPGKRSMAVAPMYHGAGFSFAYAALYTGGTLSILPKWDPENALSLIDRDSIESMFLVPTHAQMLQNLENSVLHRFNLSSLKTIYFNAAPFPFALKEWVVDFFPHTGIHELYGSTEACVVTCLRPDQQLEKPGSVGTPWLLNEVSLRDEDGKPVAYNEIGQLYSRSPYLMTGYLDNPEATEAVTTSDGYITAGDMARFDEEGYIYIVDRKGDLIISGGVNIYPREIEEVLHSHSDISQAAVVGLPSEKWGEEVTAVIVLREGSEVSPEELDQFCESSLAGYKIPKRYVFQNTIPVSVAGKVLKKDLRDSLS